MLTATAPDLLVEVEEELGFVVELAVELAVVFPSRVALATAGFTIVPLYMSQVELTASAQVESMQMLWS